MPTVHVAQVPLILKNPSTQAHSIVFHLSLTGQLIVHFPLIRTNGVLHLHSPADHHSFYAQIKPHSPVSILMYGLAQTQLFDAFKASNLFEHSHLLVWLFQVKLFGHLHSPETKILGLKHSHCLEEELKYWLRPHETQALPFQFWFRFEQ